MKSGKAKSSGADASCQVAIVGMSCLFPKAGDLKQYWENILNKVDAVTEVPGERWDWRDYFSEDKKARDKIYSRWGGFIDPIVFNPTKYGIPPSNLKSIDPVQLLSLEVAGRALRDAGYLDKEFDREHTATIFGLAGGMGDFGLQYGFRASLPLFFPEVPEEVLSQLPEWTEDSFPGVLPNVVTGRIANAFNLGGPNFTVDAACASALTAVYIGVKEILSGVVTTAIVGAADTLQNPHGFLCFSKCTALSGSGKPKPFDEGADGICISEGLGAVILKRLDLAQKDGDRIYAVIRGVGSSSDGKGKSLTAPRREGQLRALDQAYRMAGFGIETVEMVEAHGTGTVVGDGTEADSVAAAYQEAGAKSKTVAVGSVKSQIGHTKGCAGVAGLIKAALSLHYKVLPPTINVSKPAAASFNDPDSAVYVNTEPRPWIAGEGPRRAGVNSFGFGGTNFHCVVEEYAAQPAADLALEAWPSELFFWRGANAAAIADQLAALAGRLGGFKGRLRDLAAHVRKAAPKDGVCLALVADSATDLATKLEIARKALAANPLTVRDPRGMFFSAKPLKAAGKMAMLFPGQGSQRPDMTRDLTVLFPELRDGFAKADVVLKERLPKKLSQFVFPPPRFSEDEEKKRHAEITATNVAQPSLGVVELAMFRILARLGLHPEMVAGHSSGEYAALCAAGVFGEETLYEILEDRGSSIIKSCKGDLGTMMAVRGDAKQVAELIKSVKGVYVANFNSPSQTIISGFKTDLEAAGKVLEAAGIKTRFIPVACAFHSPIIEPARDFLGRKLAAIEYARPSMTVYANVLAAPYPDDKKKMREVLTDHLIAPVRFVEQIERMYADGARVFVETGPGNVLTGLVNQILEGKDYVVVAMDAKSGKHDLVQFQTSLAQLLAEGVAVDTTQLETGRRIASLDAALQSTAPAEKTSPVAYTVAPDRAWPASQSRPLRVKVPIVLASLLDEERARFAADRAAQPAAPVAAPAGTFAPVAAPTSPLGAMLVQQQQMMSAFLQQQRDLMMALVAQRGTAPVAAPRPVAAPAQMTSRLQSGAATPATAPTASAARPTGPVAPSPVPANAPTGDAKAKLIDLVASRTGYPAEMLGVDLNIESDLGIDSIKKMEILIAFAKEFAGVPEDLPEKLAGAKTLGEVLGRVSGYSLVVTGASAATSVVKTAGPVAPAPSATPAPTGDAKARLIDLVASRTGYPAEMLGIDLNIESDLGIDSIKKMEILIAFAKELTGAPEDLPEKLAGAKTLAEVLTKVSGHSLLVTGASAATPVAKTAGLEAPAPMTTATGDAKARLIDLVASRTGYPTEMLGLDLNIESDLGIDSIKKMEILIAFAKELPGAPEDLPEKLAGAKTLGEVLGRVSGYSLVVTGASASTAKPAGPVAPSPVPASAPAGDAKTTLIDLVAARTGYPTEMLGLDLNIESDLGIDSIKKMEILIAFAKDLPGAPDDLPEKLAGAKTLGEVLGRVSGYSLVVTGTNSTPSTAAAPVAPSPSSENAGAGIKRLLVQLVETPAGKGKATPPKGVVLITDDGKGAATQLKKDIEKAGGKAEIVPVAALASFESAGAVVAASRTKHGAIGGVLHLAPLRDAPSVDSMKPDVWRQWAGEEVRGLFLLLRHAAADLKNAKDGWVLSAAISGPGAISGSLPDPDKPWRAGLTGLLKCACDEWTGCVVKAVDLDTADAAKVSAALFAEVAAGRDVKEVYLRGTKRHVTKLVETPFDTKPAGVKLTNGDVILVLGGARGITGLVAGELARRVKPTFILAGRSAWPKADESARTASLTNPADIKKIVFEELAAGGQKPKPVDVEKACQRILQDREMRAMKASLETHGAKVVYHSVDVSDGAALEKLISSIYRDHGRLDGVLNGAGIIEDKLIEDKTPESFDRVFNIKVNSVHALARSLRPDGLKFVCLFSSIAGWYGNRGQGDYAAANEIYNRMAIHLSAAWQKRVVAIGWGPWDQTGMASEQVKKQFRERGVGLVQPAAGQRFCVDELLLGANTPATAVVIAEGELT